ncbi:MAG: SMC family ATPase [Treponema sp.]|nr:SMC family ATPase [Treponema sp.]
MRPLKLVMEGFGTYCKETIIDMQKLGSSGLYLITGDTGAGKTTIFDAITYALYGKVNGSDRKVSMVRSTFAGPETPTRVELTFSYNGNEYKVERNPEYERRAKRGEGTTKQPADATLYLPGGKTVNQDKKVTEAITELLRLDADQFSQIVMIAQGEFRQLLMSKTEDKQLIFRKLFKTDCYETLQYRLNDAEKTLGNSVNQSRRDIQLYVNNIVCEPDDVLNLEVEKAKKNELPVAEEIELVKKIIESDTNIKTALDEDLFKTQKELNTIIGLLAQNEQIDDIKKSIKQKKADIETAQNAYNKAKEQYDKQKEQAPKLKEKENTLAIKNKSLADYDVLDSLQKSIQEAEQASKINKDLLKTESDTLESLKNKKTTDSDALKKLSKADTDVLAYKGEKDKLLERKNKLVELQSLISQNSNLQQTYQRCVKDYNDAKTECDEADSNYKQKRRLFMDQQAGIMAEELADGKPCPVCGSTTHPHPAVKAKEAPSQEELNQLEEEAKTANEKEKNANTRCVEAKKDCDNSIKNITIMQKQLFEKDTTAQVADIKLLEQICASEIETLENQFKAVEEKLNTALDDVEKKNRIEKNLPELEENIKKSDEVVQKYQNKITELSASLKEKEKQEKALIGKLDYKSKAEAVVAVNNLREEIHNQQTAIDEAKKLYDSAVLAFETAKSECKQLEDKLVEWEPVDVSGTEEENLKLKKKIDNLSLQKTTVESRLSQNKKALQQIQATSEELILKENKYAWISSLSKTANGTLTGNKEKIKLETYIQMTYFDKILAHANKRLMIMSDNQYELLRQRGSDNHKSQTGLDLDVIDHYTGGVRSVKTLSGGESFQASLALALGLSDEVRISAGGIKIDSMFVDEGFGTLDTETQQKAYKALSTISEGTRLIGIISHVDLLKEKIDRQIVVRKERTGGSTVKLMV